MIGPATHGMGARIHGAVINGRRRRARSGRVTPGIKIHGVETNGRAVANGRLHQVRSGLETLGMISRHRETGQEINGRPHQARSGLETPGMRLRYNG